MPVNRRFVGSNREGFIVSNKSAFSLLENHLEGIAQAFKTEKDLRKRIESFASKIIQRHDDVQPRIANFISIINFFEELENDEAEYGTVALLGILDCLRTVRTLSKLLPYEELFRQILPSLVKVRLGSKYSRDLCCYLTLLNSFCKRNNISMDKTDVVDILSLRKFCLIDLQEILEQPVALDSINVAMNVGAFLFSLCDVLSACTSNAVAANCFERDLIPDGGNKSPNDHFYAIKRFGSLYPAILGGAARGGGFFIKWCNLGIVIDPGYQFIDQLYENGYSIQDIDYIFITHAHDDHSADIEKICSVLHKLNKKRKQNRINDHIIRIFGSENVSIKFSYIERSDDVAMSVKGLKKNSDCHVVNDKLAKHGIPIRIATVSAYHAEKPFYGGIDGSSIGIGIKLLLNNKSPITVLFSGDTKYEKNLAAEYAALDPDILILNVGNLEYDYSSFDSNHLGFFGCFNVIRLLIEYGKLPQLILLNECGYEWREFRLDISQQLQFLLSKFEKLKPSRPIHILPVDNNLVINLDDMTIRASGGEYKKIGDIRVSYGTGDEIKYV